MKKRSNNLKSLISILISIAMILTSSISAFAVYPDDPGYDGNGKMYNGFSTTA